MRIHAGWVVVGEREQRAAIGPTHAGSAGCGRREICDIWPEVHVQVRRDRRAAEEGAVRVKIWHVSRAGEPALVAEDYLPGHCCRIDRRYGHACGRRYSRGG